MAKSTRKPRKLKSKNPDIQFVDLGLCADRECDKYTDYEQDYGIVQFHRHVWVLDRGASQADVIALAEGVFGGSCIDITNGLKV